jgi:hypothetical protein
MSNFACSVYAERGNIHNSFRDREKCAAHLSRRVKREGFRTARELIFLSRSMPLSWERAQQQTASTRAQFSFAAQHSALLMCCLCRFWRIRREQHREKGTLQSRGGERRLVIKREQKAICLCKGVVFSSAFQLKSFSQSKTGWKEIGLGVQLWFPSSVPRELTKEYILCDSFDHRLNY